MYREQAAEDESDPTESLLPTNEPYNAVIEMYTRVLADDPDLLPTVTGIVQQMQDQALKYKEVGQDGTTRALVLKACSLVKGDDAAKEEALQLAESTFHRLEEDEGQSPDLTYYHMMKCVSNLVEDPDVRRERILTMFSDACEKGLVSANVLRTFRNQVPQDLYTQKVGSGR